MIKTIILLVIVFYTFPCRKINAQSRDTSNIFAGYYIAVYNKSDLSHKKIRRHHKHSYNTAIDSRYRTYFIPIKIGKNNINQENIWKEVTDNKTESDTIFIFPDSTDIKLFKQIGLIDSNISDKKHLLLQEIKSLPYYNTASNKAYLFKCLYVKGTFLQLRIDTIDKNWQDYLLDIYSISTKKKKKLLLVTGIDSLHSIKSDGTSIQARPYIKTGQQKPCTALIVGNWFAGEEGYIRKEALLEQGEPFVSWIRCNDCPQIRFNESNSGSVVYPGPPVSWNDPSNTDDPQAGYGYIPNDTTKEETFFYHNDHLGSTSYITDDHANITQYDAYLPYGELLVDEHSSSEDMPYKFNGKELDEETGLYYYGARYMDPKISMWLGVDPLTEKYISVSGYVYCIGNPIRFVDPNGCWHWEKNGNLHADRKDNTKTLAQFLGTSQKDVLQILNRNNIRTTKGGNIAVRNLSKLSLDKGSLYTVKADLSGTVLEQTPNLNIVAPESAKGAQQDQLAISHYYFGNGEPADVGDIATNLLINTKTFQDNLKAVTTKVRDKNSFDVDMTALVFHIGKTGVSYAVHPGKQTSHVDFTLFRKPNYVDGFRDPLDLGFELGGTPYDYKARTVTYYFKPVLTTKK